MKTTLQTNGKVGDLPGRLANQHPRLAAREVKRILFEQVKTYRSELPPAYRSTTLRKSGGSSATVLWIQMPNLRRIVCVAGTSTRLRGPCVRECCPNGLATSRP